ncbi:uncharacterized protein EV154DRAFT_517853 [Mucor mucedo]|uniref:uncharacterized protein n=1 Tax=Mucor mucedo TaxID=29922 RepID=UPI00221FDEAA|nr:uncharacterized protein EV154DRAFT_517853 [Mucor mucedo]KAI7888419.1 hypothetical protein EV154DRAFT_517853 [Mucor mucedo]
MSGYASHYLSKIYNAFTLSWSVTTTQQTQESDMQGIDEDYCIVKCASPSSVQSTLTLIEGVPINFHHTQDILDEFYLMHDKLYHTCHQFDACRVTEQFSNTHFKMGSELKLLIRFMARRYGDNGWLTLMGLLMIARQVLTTPSQVKKELLHVTMIGRELAVAMLCALSCKSTVVIHTHLKVAILEILQCRQWFPSLRDTCLELSQHDKDWELHAHYHQVVSMATQYVSQGDQV